MLESVGVIKLTPRRPGSATMYLLAAYGIVTLMGILLTIVLGFFYPFNASKNVPMVQIRAYAMSVPFHPLLNLAVWPAFGWRCIRISVCGGDELEP